MRQIVLNQRMVQYERSERLDKQIELTQRVVQCVRNEGANRQIVLNQKTIQIVIRGGAIVTSTLLPFSVVAVSNGQTRFTLPYAYTQIICFFIMGTGQDPIVGDYTLEGNVAVLGESAPYINAGDIIFGSGQVQ